MTFPLPAGQHSFYFKGIAIQADPGTAVKAVWDGEVARVRETDFPRGASVTLLHDDGKVTVYGGLERSAVQKGDLLKQGIASGCWPPPAMMSRLIFTWRCMPTGAPWIP